MTLKANELILKKRRSNKAVSRLELKTTKRCKLSAIVELKSIITVMARLIEVECALCVNLCVYLFFFFFFLMMLTEVYSNISYRLKSFLKPRKRFFSCVRKLALDFGLRQEPETERI